VRLLAGLLLAPQNWAPANVQGVNYVPSIAAGALISAPIVNGALVAAARERVDLQPKAAALPGIAAGAVWCARPRRACANGKRRLRGATPAQRPGPQEHRQHPEHPRSGEPPGGVCDLLPDLPGACSANPGCVQKACRRERAHAAASAQCGLVVAGLWGIVLFRELKGRQQIGYWASTGAPRAATRRALPAQGRP